MTYETIRVDIEHGGIAHVVLDRPEVKNAFNDLMLRELAACVDELNEDESVRVVAVSGSGGEFSSGRDTRELSMVGQRDSMRAWPQPGGHESSMFAALQMPTFALVDGVCVGGSLGFALQCDIRIATTRARFLDGHLPNGISPSVAVWYLPRLMNRGQALRFLTARKVVGAEEARDIGLVDAVVEPADLDGCFRELAAPFLDAEPRLVRHTKALLEIGAELPYHRAMTSVGLVRTVERLERRSGGG